MRILLLNISFPLNVLRIADSDQNIMFVSVIDNKAENMALIERMNLNKNDLS